MSEEITKFISNLGKILSGGSKGGAGDEPLSRYEFFNFHAVFGRNFAK